MECLCPQPQLTDARNVGHTESSEQVLHVMGESYHLNKQSNKLRSKLLTSIFIQNAPYIKWNVAISFSKLGQGTYVESDPFAFVHNNDHQQWNTVNILCVKQRFFKLTYKDSCSKCTWTHTLTQQRQYNIGYRGTTDDSILDTDRNNSRCPRNLHQDFNDLLSVTGTKNIATVKQRNP